MEPEGEEVLGLEKGVEGGREQRSGDEGTNWLSCISYDTGPLVPKCICDFVF